MNRTEAADEAQAKPRRGDLRSKEGGQGRKVKPSMAKFQRPEDLGRFILFQLGMQRRRGTLYVYRQPGGAIVISPVALEGVYELDYGEKP